MNNAIALLKKAATLNTFESVDESLFLSQSQTRPTTCRARSPKRLGGSTVMRRQSMKKRQETVEIDSAGDYLSALSIGIDMSFEMKVLRAFSNKYMSVLIVQINTVDLEAACEGDHFIRCYHNRRKFFEMPLNENPIFIDVFDSVIAYILDSELENKKLFVIDVGQIENEEREISETQGLEEPLTFTHDFEEPIIGMKLGTLINHEEGNKKVVVWGETNAYIFSFNPDASKMEDNNQILKNRKEVEFEIPGDIEIQKIWDFGCNSQPYTDYEDDMPECFLIESSDGVLCLLSGVRYGQEFGENVLQYPPEDGDYPFKISQCLQLVLLQIFKVIGIIVKENINTGEESLCVQVFEFSFKDEKFIPTISFPLRNEKVPTLIEQLGFYQVMDSLNDFILFEEFCQSETQCILQVPISNNISGKFNRLQGDFTMGINLVANNVKLLTNQERTTEKTKGLLITDFCCSDNLMVVIHGKVISCYDLMNINKDTKHTTFKLMSGSSEKQSFYNFEEEPLAVWMMDKADTDTSKRWKVIVAFRNGELRELEYLTLGKNNQIQLQSYLEGEQKKLPGQIKKILRNRNAQAQPVYFLLDIDGKEVISTVEFQSRNVRTFEIPFFGQIYSEEKLPNVKVKYVILGITDTEKRWQEVACFLTYQEQDHEVIEQKLVLIKLRIGQYQLSERSREVIKIEERDLPTQMRSVQESHDLFVNGEKIYFLFKNFVECYNLSTNKVVRVVSTENITKLLNLDDSFYYWRTSFGGTNYNKYRSRIYFDRIESIKTLGTQCSNKEVALFEGIYPHLNKLQYDPAGEYLAGFINFYELKVFPLLHQNRLKIPVEGKRHTDYHLLASKLCSPNYILTLHSNNTLRVWNCTTGKYLVNLEREVDSETEGSFGGFIFHQKISDSLTLIRSVEKAFSDEDIKGILKPEFDLTDEVSDIYMHRYKLIRVNTIGAMHPSFFRVEVIKSFLGPHIYNNANFGLFSNDDGSRFAFFYKNTQEKLQINYFNSSGKCLTDKFEGDKDEYELLKRTYKQEEKFSKISIHSPNFKFIVSSLGGNYEIRKAISKFKSGELIEEEPPLFLIPYYLSKSTVQPPSFLDNTSLLFLSADKIVKSVNFCEQNEENYQMKTLNDFMVSHCNFPGAGEQINLSSIHCIGDEENRHIIGENCLVYEQLLKQRIDKEDQPETELIENIAPNCFNSFFKEAASEHQNDEYFSELKFIQCRYKTKIELLGRSINGYLFSSAESQRGETSTASTSLYVISTFTYYHWRLIELIVSKRISISDIPLSILKELCFVQLPNQTTLLHQVISNTSTLEKLVLTLLEANDKLESDDPNLFFLPLLKNKLERNPLEQSLDIINELKVNNDAISKVQNAFAKKLMETEDVFNRKAAELLIKMISKYPFNLFNLNLKDSIPKMLQYNLIELSTLLDNCLKEPQFLKDFERGSIFADEYFGALQFQVEDVWSPEIKAKTEENFKFQKAKGAEEKLISLKVMDIPFIHVLGDENSEKMGQKESIFRELCKTKNQELFQKLPIKALIEANWPPIRKAIILWLFCPYILFLSIFAVYTMLDLESNDRVALYLAEGKWIVVPLQALCRILILFFAFYFVGIELWELRKKPRYLKIYLSNSWKYLDIIPAFMIFTAECINLLSNTELSISVVRVIYSLTSILLWLRFLYFVRIFRSMGYYIFMIKEVIFDMKEFLLIFLIAILAFGQAFFIFFQNATIAEESNQFHTGFDAFIYMYRVALSDIDTSNFELFQPWIAWTLFVISTMYVLIVLLNLLISIVGDTFDRVNQDSTNMMYKDMVGLIVENQFLVNKNSSAKTSQRRYLMLAIPEDLELNVKHQNGMKQILAVVWEMNQTLKRMELNQRSLIKDARTK